MLQYLYIGALAAFGLGVILWIPYRVMRREDVMAAGNSNVCPGFRPADGLAYFCANMIVFLLTAPYIQGTYGLLGLLITELLLLAPALMMPFLTRIRPRRFFQLRRPSTRHTAGGIFLWMGALLGISVVTSLLLMVFPNLANETEGINAFMRSESMALRLICVVLAPAVCEELFHRGVVLAAFRGRFNDAFIVVVMGLLFGVFHMDPARFHSTALLGMALTYAALRARSVVLPILLHCVNNLLSVGVNFWIENSDAVPETAATGINEGAEALLALIGQSIIAILALLLLTVGYMLLRDEKRPLRARKNPIVIIAAAIAVVLTCQAAVTLARL
jgi:membrane protease YdiL (CAAX protease family)